MKKIVHVTLVLSLSLIHLFGNAQSTSGTAAPINCDPGYKSRNVMCHGQVVEACVPEQYSCKDCWALQFQGCDGKWGTGSLFNHKSYDDCEAHAQKEINGNIYGECPNEVMNKHVYRIYCDEGKFCSAAQQRSANPLTLNSVKTNDGQHKGDGYSSGTNGADANAQSSYRNKTATTQISRAMYFPSDADFKRDGKRLTENVYYPDATLGNADAQYHLGMAYLNGMMGLPKNITSARIWLAHAANNGSIAAKEKLKEIGY